MRQLDAVAVPAAPQAAPGLTSATEIRLLGTLRATIAGRRVDDRLPGRKGRLLFAFLVLHRDRRFSRDEIAEVVWAADQPASPERALRTLLARLRHAVGDDTIPQRGAVALQLPEDALVDVEAARQRLDSARRALGGAQPGRALAEARAAHDWLAGVLLPEFGDTWVEDSRRELGERAAEALELCARSALALPEADEHTAALAARRLIEREPFRESGYELLMRAHVRAGNPAEALRVFERLRVLLRDELGTRPSPALLALHRQVLTGEPAPPPRRSRPPEPTAPERRALPLPATLRRLAREQFVGREPELAAVADGWARALNGDRELVVLVGEPGIGKSSLAAQFAERVGKQGATVLHGSCDEHPIVPYQPFAEVLRAYVRHVPSLAARAPEQELAELGKLVPELREHAPADVSGPDGDESRYRLFEAVRTVLARAAGDAPLLVVLDDMHWADRSTLLLLRHVVQQSAGVRALILVTVREAEAAPGHPWADVLGDLERSGAVRRVRLAGLAPRESASLIQAYLGVPPSSAVARRWHERTEGHPFFLHEILRQTDRAALIAEPAAELPLRVTDSIALRVSRTGREPAAILGLAAVVGREFGLELVAALADRSIGTTLGALEDAIRHGLVVELPEFDRFVFSHALIRETLYGRMARSRRIREHERIGELLERQVERSSPAELAWHFFNARPIAGHEKAVRYSVKAAGAAEAALAYEEAAAHYERALIALEAAPPGAEPERCELLLRLGDVQRRAGDAGVESTFRRAAESARERGDAEQLARAALAGRHYESGDPDEERVALLEEALSRLGGDDSVLRVRVMARLAEAAHFAGHADRALAISREGIEVAQRLGEADAQIAALLGRHGALMDIAHVLERIAVLEELVRLADATGDRELAAHGHQWLTYAWFELGDFEAARREHRRFASLTEELRQPRYDHVGLAWKAVFAQLDGRLQDAEALAMEGYALAERVQGIDAMALLGAQLLFIRRDQDRLPEILPAIEEFAKTSDLARWQAVLGLALAAAGDVERAGETFAALERAGLERRIPRDFWWLTTMTLLAEGCSLVGDAARAADLYGRLEPYAEFSVQVAFATHLGSVQRCLGLLAATLGDEERAARHLDAALERHPVAEARALLVRTHCDYARFLHRRGRDAGAQAHLGQARELAGGTDLHALVDAAAQDTGQPTQAGSR